MKAVYFKQTGGIEDLQFGSLPETKKDLKEGELRLGFLAGSLNHLDLWVLKGLDHLRYEFPHIAGADFCGEVLESRSKDFKVGDRVILYPAYASEGSGPENLRSDFGIRGENYPGVFREELVSSDQFVFPAPQYLETHEAAALPLVYLTAWQMLSEKAEIETGWNEGPVLVHGAGSGVSQALLEMLLALGVRKIATTSRTPAKLRAWEARGVSGFVWDEKLFESLKGFAGRERFSTIFDHIGQRAFEMNIRLLRKGGRFVTCGATSGFESSLDLRQVFFRQLQLLGSTMGSLRHFSELLRFVEKHQIRPGISDIFPWSEPQQAYRQMEESAQNGKILLSAMN